MNKEYNAAKEYDVAIIGAGICGLTTAYKLSEKGKKVIIIEKENTIGGALKTIKRNNYQIEEFYHHIFYNDYFTKKLIEELGLKEKLAYHYSKTAFIYPERVYDLSSPTKLLRFKRISFVKRIILGFFLAKVMAISNYRKYDNITAKEYICKNVGKTIYDEFFREMLIGKFGENSDEISASWFISRIKLRSKRTRKGELLGYVENSFGILINELEKRIKSNNNSDIITNSELYGFEINEDKIVSIKVKNIDKKGKERIINIKAKHIVSTIPLNSLFSLISKKKIFSGLGINISQDSIPKFEPQGALCLVLGLKRKITDYYWSTVEIPGKKVRAIIEHTNLIPESKYGENIIYLASYPSNNDEIWRMNDTEIIRIFLNDIKSHTEIRKEDIIWAHVSRLKDAGLIYKRGLSYFLEYLEKSKTGIKNLYFGGMFVQFPERAIERSIKQANNISEIILNKENIS